MPRRQASSRRRRGPLPHPGCPRASLRPSPACTGRPPPARWRRGAMPAYADLNRFEAEQWGDFGIGSAAQFGSADLKKAVHVNENFRRANFTSADMRESDFSGSTFNGAYLEKAVAYKANFTGKLLNIDIVGESTFFPVTLARLEEKWFSHELSFARKQVFHNTQVYKNDEDNFYPAKITSTSLFMFLLRWLTSVIKKKSVFPL